ncbi:MAG: hypothetical protein ABI896_08285 [Actinomycetota bacterium]
MHCGTPGRTPPRRPAFVGRLLRLVLPLVLASAFWAGPAASYQCGRPSSGTRAVAAHLAKADATCEPSKTFGRRHGNADPMSFAFFIGIVIAVLLVPVALGRREELPPQ